MERLSMNDIQKLKESLNAACENNTPVENHFTLSRLIKTIEDMNVEIQQSIRLQVLQANMVNKSKLQLVWRREVINLAIEALTEPTHRYRDDACKKLLKCLKNMPEIQPYDIGIESDELPF